MTATMNPTPALTIVQTAVFVIVAVVAYQALRTVAPDSRVSRMMMALAVATLSALGLKGTTVSSGPVHLVLLPYAALGLTLLLFPIAVILVRMWERRASKARQNGIEACQRQTSDWRRRERDRA